MKLYKLNSINSKNVTAEQRAHIILNNFNENIIYKIMNYIKYKHLLNKEYYKKRLVLK